MYQNEFEEEMLPQMEEKPSIIKKVKAKILSFIGASNVKSEFQDQVLIFTNYKIMKKFYKQG
jgi:hypothetical protein